MKKIVIVAGMVLAGASAAFAQGVVWNNEEPGSVVAHVYSPVTGNSEVQGNIATPFSHSTPNGDFPAGTQTYAGATLIGGTATGSGSTAYGNGDLFAAALYGAAGSSVPASSLTLVPGSTTTFVDNNTHLAGFINAPGSDPVVTGSSYGGTVTLQAVAWYANAGQYTFATSPETGVSTPFNVTLAGSPTAADPTLNGLTSFSLVNTTPEPSTIALGVMGASAFLLRRRMSK